MGNTAPLDVLKTATGWQAIESHLPEDFEALAKEHKVIEVQYGEGVAKIRTASALLRLVLLHAGVGLGMRQTVALVAASGGPDISHVTLHKKERLSASYLAALVGRLTSMSAETAPERWAGYELALVDGSSFCEPGAEGTSARIHLQLRLSDLAILAVSAEDASVGETFKRFPWREGQLALGDRGYANPPGVATVVRQRADVLVRVNRAALPMYMPDATGERVNVMEFMRSLKGYMPREKRVVVRSREHGLDVVGRLIAVRLPESQAEKARAWVRRELGSKATATDLEAAHYVVLFATVPVERMSVGMCLELYRLRWQVELAFKRWKSLCAFDHVPNHRDDTILTWLYAKLLLAVLMQRMASGDRALFPPATDAEESDALVRDALDNGQHLLARNHRGLVAA